MNVVCTWRVTPSRVTRAVPMEMLDSRRLTGPNLLMDGAGAAMEVRLQDAEAEQVIGLWRKHLSAMLEELGWEGETSHVRRFEGGATLAFSAPIDALYAACEANEWALEAAREERVGGTVSREDGARRLRELIAEEVNPALLLLRDAARTHGVAFLSDDDVASVGLGKGSQSWPVGALPEAKEVNWAAVHDVPVVLVTGTNGKSTTVRLMAAMVEAAGLVPGVSSTDWIRVGDEVLDTGDYSGPGGARAILRDTRTDIAILETARGGMFRRGLAVERADAAAVLNVAEDHLGEWGVGDLDALVEGKFVLAKAVDEKSRLILNADEAPVVAKGKTLDKPILWFGLDPTQPDIARRCRRGGDACFWEDGTLFLQRGDDLEALISEATLPISFGGKARFNTSNALAASALASCAGIPAEAIRDGLGRFESSPQANPGRGNLFRIGGATVFADFAHNPHGFKALFQMAEAFSAGRTCVLLGQAGDRTDADVRALCEATAEAAPDLILVKEMPEHYRGREPGEMTALIETELTRAGVSQDHIAHAPSELSAVEQALAWSLPGDLLLLLLHAQRAEVLELLGHAAHGASSRP